jgi:excisionase family DNA binding protein
MTNRHPNLPQTSDSQGHRHPLGRMPRYYSVRAVAEALDVSDRTVRRWIANGDLVAHRLAGIRIADVDLRSFLALRREG